MKFSKLLLMLILCVVSVYGEEAELVTDRPDFTESASSVPLGSWQLEFGYTYEESDDVSLHTVGELLVRYSFMENFELRVGVNSFAAFRSDYGDADGFEDMELGFKWALVPDKVALLVSTSIPTGASEFRSNKLQPGIVLSLAHDISDTVSLGANFGITRLSDDEEYISEYSASVAAGIGLTPKLGIFIEYFGFYYGEEGIDDNHFVDGGFTYLLKPNFQLDIRSGKLLKNDISAFFFGVGGTVRF
ncbi:MAG: transporter [bacterium]|nr:transporter [bacterium]